MADNRLKDRNWEPGEDGKAPTWERLQIAIMLDIRDTLWEQKRIQREQADSLNTVRHFFHRLGERKIKRLIDESFRKADLQRSRRLRYNKSRRAKP